MPNIYIYIYIYIYIGAVGVPRRLQMRGHRQSADMHFTWPAWDKTQSRLALFRKCVCVASVSVCRGNPFRETKHAFLCGKTPKAFRKACSHAFYVACVGQNPVSVSSVREPFLRSLCHYVAGMDALFSQRSTPWTLLGWGHGCSVLTTQ